MADFICTHNRRRLVNLDHVTTMKWNGRDYELLDRDGADLGTVDDGDGLWFYYTIIPAAPGIYATLIRCCYEAEARPTEDDVHVERAQIIAWRIDPRSEHPKATPIVAATLVDDPHVFVERPDGSLDEQDMWTYSDLDKAKAGVLEIAQNSWEMNKRLKEERATSSPPATGGSE